MRRPFLVLLATALAVPLAGAQQPRPRRELTGAKGPIRNIAFSRDGKAIAAGVWAEEVRIWDVATGKQTHLLADGAGMSIAAPAHREGRVV